VPQATDLILTWAAAQPNGDAITGYEVSWSAATGDQGSTTVAGDALTATIGTLPRNVPYRISVAARNRNGLGEAAQIDATMPTRWIRVSRGNDTTYEHGCDHPSCAFINVEVFGFPPKTKISIVPFASDWGKANTGAKIITDADGHIFEDERFPFNGVGQTVWVDVDDIQSNRLRWPERGPQ
jgi:hypothetical protein